jgi:hypothetical protein
VRKIEIIWLRKKGNFMNKLFINLLLILGINFSLLGSDQDISERQLIYEEENRKAEGDHSPIHPVVFDRSIKRFEFDGSREDLPVYWVVGGQRVSEKELENNPLSKRGPTYCFVNTAFLPGGCKESRQEVDLAGSQEPNVMMVVHTKYNLDPTDSEHEEISKEATEYAQRVDAYNKLTKEERKKQIRMHLKRRNKDDRPKTPTHMDPNSSKQ